MSKKNDRVKVSGTISRETAEAWQRGDLKNNNGLRQAHGRASLNSEQPDVHIDTTPTVGQQLMEDIKYDLAIGLRVEFNRIMYTKIFPWLEDLIWNRAFQLDDRKINEYITGQPKALQIIDKKAMFAEEDQPEENTALVYGENIIDFMKYRKAVGQ